jgi:2-phospho-L-lactate guanylyltransferase
MRRLEGILDIAQREALGRALCSLVVSTARSADAEPLIVTADPAVREWGEERDLAVVTDPDQGLDEACRAGVEQSQGRPWLILHSDLPMLVETDVAAALGAIVSGRDVIAPSADGGTSAISARGPIRFSFGEGSFHRHLPRLRDPVIATRLGWLHDLDDDVDLVSALRHPRGRWMLDVVRLPSDP